MGIGKPFGFWRVGTNGIRYKPYNELVGLGHIMILLAIKPICQPRSPATRKPYQPTCDSVIQNYQKAKETQKKKKKEIKER